MGLRSRSGLGCCGEKRGRRREGDEIAESPHAGPLPEGEGGRMHCNFVCGGEQSGMSDLVNTFVRESESLEHTGVIAKDFASVLRAGDLVRLVGEMGAGKTTFVRLVAEHMGVDLSLVSSPTFVLMNHYPCKVNGEDGSIAHLDCYRFGDADELEALGWDRVCSDGSIRLVEWPERIDDVLDEESCTVSISHVDEGARGFEISVPGPWVGRASIGALKARDRVKCPTTGEVVHPECGSWPFISERAQMSDLHGWMSGKFSISRSIEEADFGEEGAGH